MHKVAKYAFFIFLFAIALFGGWYGFKRLSKAPTAPEPTLAQTISPADAIAAAQVANSAGLSERAASAATESAQTSFSQTYKDSAYGFSFSYPNGLKIGMTDENDARTVLAQNAESHVGFQVSVRSWAGGENLTAEKVQADLPEIVAYDFKPVNLGGAAGIAFGAKDANFGDSIQVWIVHRGYLYQVSTYATQGPLLSKVLGTWKWEQ